MDFSILTYDFSKQFNIGDYIQSLAAKQFLPQVDHYICRERLHEYKGPETKMIMNGWFKRHTKNWPPSNSIKPLFISFHMNTKRMDDMLGENGIAYFQKYGPVGCRDFNTKKKLEEGGVNAYFSGCLTLTLGKSYRHRADESIYLTDVLHTYPTRKSVFKSLNSFQKSVKTKDIFRLGKQKKIVRDILGSKILESTKVITHIYPSNDYPIEESRLKLAEKTLKKYERAKLVITSRIHCALPCLAMGTPVIFINGGFKPTQTCRFDGITDLFHTVNVSENGTLTFNFDIDAVRKSGQLKPKTAHLKYVDALNDRCRKFILER